MTTLQEFELVLRQLPPGAATILRELLRNPLAPQASARLLDLVRLMLGGAAGGGLGANWELLRRALVLLARLGGLAPRTLLPVIGTIEAELAAAAAAGSGGAGAGGAGAGGAAAGAGGAVALGTVLAILAAVLAVAFAFWSIGSEVMKEIELPQDGQPCALDTAAGVAMAMNERKLYARGVGQKTALQRAIDRAASACSEDAGQCGGGECREGSTCRPVASITSVDLKWRLFWTTAHITYTCPCACLPDE